MPLKNCTLPRYGFRKTKPGRQRLAFCGSRVIEVAGFKNHKKVFTKRLAR